MSIELGAFTIKPDDPNHWILNHLKEGDYKAILVFTRPHPSGEQGSQVLVVSNTNDETAYFLSIALENVLGQEIDDRNERLNKLLVELATHDPEVGQA